MSPLWATGSELDLPTAQRLVDEGQFGAGSMLPKVQAAMQFAASAPGRRAVICSLEKAPLAMQGRSGTVIHAIPDLVGASAGRPLSDRGGVTA